MEAGLETSQPCPNVTAGLTGICIEHDKHRETQSNPVLLCETFSDVTRTFWKQSVKGGHDITKLPATLPSSVPLIPKTKTKKKTTCLATMYICDLH